MKTRSPLIFAATFAWLAMAGVPEPASAGGTRSIRVTTYQEFAEGQDQGVLITSQGDVQSGWSTTKTDLPQVGDDAIRTMVAAPDRTIYIGTGGESPNVHIYQAGKLRKLAKLPTTTWVSALAVRATPMGNHVLAATVADGRIFDIAEDGKVELWATVEADHIWAIQREGNQTIVATAPGRLLLIQDTDCGPTAKLGANQKTKSKILFESPARHFLSLTKGEPGVYYVGTSDEAILYRITLDKEGRATARATHDFAGNEVRAVAAKDGKIFVAVNDMQRGDTQLRGTKLTVPAAGTAPGVKPAPPSGTTAPPSTSPVEKKGRGGLFRIDEAGRVEQLHAISDGFFNDLAVDEDGSVLAAASTPGGRGRVYRALPDRTVMTALEFKESDVLALAWSQTERIVGTGSAAGLFQVQTKPATGASYQSKVLDATAIARFGALRFLAEGVRVETRSGNVQKPDAAWSAWQPLAKVARVALTGEQTGEIGSPPGRYLQVRFLFAEKSVLKDFSVYYQPLNQRPRLTDVTIGEDPLSRLAKGVKPSYLRPKSPIVKIRWKVENPDEDDLNYRVFIRRIQSTPAAPGGPAGDVGFLRISGVDPLTRTELDLNTETVGDGLYEVKVTVSDERSNQTDLALTHELSSPPFLIDNRRPEWLDVRFDATSQLVSARITDSASPITDLSLSIDGGDFQPLTSRDGILDSPSEEIEYKLARLSPGAHTLLLRGSDAADNVATTQLVIQSK